MTPKTFADCIHKEVVEENLKYYGQCLVKPPDQFRDGAWQKIAQAFRTMNEEQQTALLLLARQATVDTASNILGILDGSSILQSYREEFCVTYGKNHDKLNGDLQDYFLARIEDEV